MAQEDLNSQRTIHLAESVSASFKSGADIFRDSLAFVLGVALALASGSQTAKANAAVYTYAGDYFVTAASPYTTGDRISCSLHHSGASPQFIIANYLTDLVQLL